MTRFANIASHWTTRRLFALTAALALQGCAVVAVVDTAASLAVGAVGLAADAAVGAVRLTGKAVGATADAVLPGPAGP